MRGAPRPILWLMSVFMSDGSFTLLRRRVMFAWNQSGESRQILLLSLVPRQQLTFGATVVTNSRRTVPDDNHWFPLRIELRASACHNTSNENCSRLKDLSRSERD